MTLVVNVGENESALIDNLFLQEKLPRLKTLFSLITLIAKSNSITCVSPLAYNEKSGKCDIPCPVKFYDVSVTTLSISYNENRVKLDFNQFK